MSIATNLVRSAVVASGHLGARASSALVITAVRHDGAGVGAVGVHGGSGALGGAVVEVIGVLAKTIVAAVVT